MSLINKEKDDIVDVDVEGNIVEESKEVELLMHIFSNQGADAPAQSLLHLFYEGAMLNTIGVMRALNSDTGLEELLLVGVEQHDANNSSVYPLAKILDRSSLSNYKSPDGKGGWFSPN
jgi:hypothetical protein